MKIMLSGVFSDKPVFRKFLILGGIVAMSSVILLMTGVAAVKLIYGIDPFADAGALADLSNPLVLSAMKVLQVFSTALGMFLVPAIVTAFLFSHQPARYLHIGAIPKLTEILLVVILIFSVAPLINLIYEFNKMLQLPEFMSGVEAWIRAKEDEMEKLTLAFLDMKTTGDLLSNVLVVGLLTALAEEFLFRGVLLRLFREMTGNMHVAILLTAILFSAIHMQFYGFIPRMLLGMLLGYLLWWSGNLWLPVLAHFINNSGAVVFAYIAARNQMPFNHETIGTSVSDLPVLIISALIAGYILFRFKKNAVAAE